MKMIFKNKDVYIIRLDRGEKFLEKMRMIAKKVKMPGAWFWGIGAAEMLNIAFYDLKLKKYVTKQYRGVFEILNITGNISKKGKEYFIHAHGTFSRPNYSTIGGHIVDFRVGGTCEIYIAKLGSLKRGFDAKTGLNLLL
ncbi:MAG: PPC domain-containing DNA-binding protein [Candidatus Paceibacteria bacterium]